MKFAHISDCHIGAWKEPKLRELNFLSFKAAVEICIKRNVDFVIIAGDLFDNAIPDVSLIAAATKELRKLKKARIPVYLIAGSHDFSISGKTMLSVLENAGLCRNLARFYNRTNELNNEKLNLQFTIDKKTGAKICGMYGKVGGMEKFDYQNLNKQYLESEQGFKIFVFHTGINELKPEWLQDYGCESMGILPRGFDYYAGGHIHYVFSEYIKDLGGRVAFPGALFPNNFLELEKFGHGSFFIVEAKEGKLDVELIELKIKETLQIDIDASGKMPGQVAAMVREKLDSENINDKIVLLRIYGMLDGGKPSEIDLVGILSKYVNAYCILKNTSNLTSKEFENEIALQTDSIEDIEKRFLQFEKPVIENSLLTALFKSLDIESEEGETNEVFENRLVENITSILQIKEFFKL